MKSIAIKFLFCLAIIISPFCQQFAANERVVPIVENTVKVEEEVQYRKLAIGDTQLKADSLMRKNEVNDLPSAEKVEETKKLSPMSFNFIYYIIYKFKDIDLSSLIPKATSVFK